MIVQGLIVTARPQQGQRTKPRTADPQSSAAASGQHPFLNPSAQFRSIFFSISCNPDGSKLNSGSIPCQSIYACTFMPQNLRQWWVSLLFPPGTEVNWTSHRAAGVSSSSIYTVMHWPSAFPLPWPRDPSQKPPAPLWLQKSCSCWMLQTFGNCTASHKEVHAPCSVPFFLALPCRKE